MQILGAKEPETPPRLLRKVAGRWVELTLIVRLYILVYSRFAPADASIARHGSYVFLKNTISTS